MTEYIEFAWERDKPTGIYRMFCKRYFQQYKGGKKTLVSVGSTSLVIMPIGGPWPWVLFKGASASAPFATLKAAKRYAEKHYLSEDFFSPGFPKERP